MRRFTLAVTLACLAGAGISTAEATNPVRGKHAQNKVSCFDCHREENPTKSAVADDSCVACHGDQPAMAEYTKSLPVNPHQIPAGKHPGPFACTECHKQHITPIVKCLECHPTFKLKAR